MTAFFPVCVFCVPVFFVRQAKKEEATARSPADLKFEEMQQYANNLDVQVPLFPSAQPNRTHPS